MVEIPLKGGEVATVGPNGVSVSTGVFISWGDLISAMYAASQCCREGSRRHDDLFQASYDYLPSLVRQFQSDDPEDAVTFCGMDRPNPGEND